MYALKKNAIKSISNKKASKFYEVKVLNIAYQKLLLNSQIKGYKAQRYDVSIQIDSANMVGKAFEGLKEITVMSNENRFRAVVQIELKKLDKIFQAFKMVTSS